MRSVLDSFCSFHFVGAAQAEENGREREEHTDDAGGPNDGVALGDIIQHGNKHIADDTAETVDREHHAVNRAIVAVAKDLAGEQCRQDIGDAGGQAPEKDHAIEE